MQHTMGGRYLISGAELGMLRALSSGKNKKKMEEIVDRILNDQFIGHSHDNLADDAALLSKYMDEEKFNV
jgi:hypothetical protein